MKRFNGMMPSDEIKKEQHFKDHLHMRIIVQAGPNGWTVLWADSSCSYKDLIATTEENFQAAMTYLANNGFDRLSPAEPTGRADG